MEMILSNQTTLKQAVEYMEKLQKKGYSCYFKTVKGEIHIIAEDKYNRRLKNDRE